MKKLSFLLVILLLLMGCGAKKVATTDIKGDLSKYHYVCVNPTNGVISSSGVYGNQYGIYGGDTHTTNPSELIAGYLMKKGYSALSYIVPDLAEQTLVVTYGETGASSILLPKAGVIIQFKDAKTHQLVASSEADGISIENEAYAIKRAIYKALDQIFSDN